MNDELNSISDADADFQQLRRLVRANQHHKVVQTEHTDGVLVGVENVVVGHTVLSRAFQNDRPHEINLS